MATRGQKISKVFYGWWIVLAAGIELSKGRNTPVRMVDVAVICSR
jgi:hypothetical protein